MKYKQAKKKHFKKVQQGLEKKYQRSAQYRQAIQVGKIHRGEEEAVGKKRVRPPPDRESKTYDEVPEPPTKKRRVCGPPVKPKKPFVIRDRRIVGASKRVRAYDSHSF